MAELASLCLHLCLVVKLMLGTSLWEMMPSSWLMKPLPQQNMKNEQGTYNYRISRAQRVVENAFGILASTQVYCMLYCICLLINLVFQILMFADHHAREAQNVQFVIIACCALHNLMRERYPMLQNAQVDQEDPLTHHVVARTLGDPCRISPDCRQGGFLSRPPK